MKVLASIAIRMNFAIHKIVLWGEFLEVNSLDVKAPISGGVILRIDQAATPNLLCDWSISVDNISCSHVSWATQRGNS